MTPTRRRPAIDRSACAGLALGVLVLAAATDAAADGEETPVLGGALLGGRGPDPDAEHVGLELEAAWWWGRVGLALEGAARWNLAEDARATSLGACARLRVLDRMLPSLLEPRDVELGVELHGIVERTWWSGDRSGESPTGLGVGLAIRLRGGSDDFPTLFTESRFFLRVVSARQPAADAVALTMSPSETRTSERTILFGIGAAFGGGEPRYLDRFRLAPAPLEIPGRR